ncbi:hypothetical protein EON80_07720 [bacterium]|nr:MAG: hypothetical protein EON80_07720 [bacterium]
MKLTRQFAAFAALSTVTSVALAAPKKPAPQKPSAKATAPASKTKLIREVLGTQQLSGYEGLLRQTFTIGKQLPLNFTLSSCEYSVGRVNIGGYAHIPKGDEKLLVLHFVVQNPTKKVVSFSTSYLRFSAVDATGVTREYVGDIAREKTGESVSLPLNPGQKTEAKTAIRVAAYGTVPKLIVRHYYETNAPIIRYDLRNVAKKLNAPYADPSDANGATALKTIAAKVGVSYPVTDMFDAELVKVEDQTAPLNGNTPEKGKKFSVATFIIRNKGPRRANLTQAYFRADLKDADGEKTNYNTWMLKGSRDEQVSNQLEPGEETKVRFFWAIPEDVEAKAVLLQYGYDRESRTFAFEVPSTN